MKRDAILIKTDGRMQGVPPANGGDFSLKELQGFVGGYIEVVTLAPDVIMVVNEDGKRDKKPNPTATVIAKASGGIFPGDWVAGDALMCPRDMVK